MSLRVVKALLKVMEVVKVLKALSPPSTLTLSAPRSTYEASHRIPAIEASTRHAYSLSGATCR